METLFQLYPVALLATTDLLTQRGVFMHVQPVGLDGLPLTPQPQQNFRQVVKDMAKNMGSKSL